MQNSIKSEFQSLNKKTGSERIKLKKRLLIYLFFLFISLVFWFLTALNKNYSVQIEFPVRYYNFPPEKVMVSDVPHHIKLWINGHGFTILKHKLYSGLSPLRIDVSGAGITAIDTASQLNYIITSRIREKLSSQIGEDLQVVSVLPDTLFFVLDDIVSKNVKVMPLLSLSFKKQFMQKRPARLVPDSIRVFGPRIIMDTLKYIYTENISKSRVNDSINKEVDLVPIRTLQYGNDRVNLFVPVEKFTEKNLSIPIEAVNLPNDLILKTFPGYINVSTLVAVSDYSKITADQFRAIVDYNEITPLKTKKLKVNLVQSPDFIVNTKYSPISVEFIIEK
jgi:hypothetical protein